MTINVKPEWHKFITEQVESGRFSSPDEVLEVALARMRIEEEYDDTLDEEDWRRIEISREQIRNGETIEAAEVHDRLRRKFLGE